jgi:hypothetical protein
LTLVSAQQDSIKLGKLPLVRHKASEVPLYSMKSSWLHLILALVPAQFSVSGYYDVDKRLIQIQVYQSENVNFKHYILSYTLSQI